LFLMDPVRIKAKKSPKGFKRWQILGTKLHKHAYRESSSPAAASWSLFGRWVWGKTECVCVCGWVSACCPWRRCKVVGESGIWEMGGEKETVNLDESYRLLLFHCGILGLGHCSTRQNLLRSLTPPFSHHRLPPI
jgi:hypothetical protein